MKPKNSLCRFLAAIGCTTIAISLASAADGTWNANAADNWSASGRWTGGTVADGIGFTANFGDVINADRIITLDTVRSIGHIYALDTTNNYTINSATNRLTLGTGSGRSVLNALSGRTLTITSPITINDGLTVDGAGTVALGIATDGIVLGASQTWQNNGRLNITGDISDGINDYSITKAGSGVLDLVTGANKTFSGGLTVQGGEIQFRKVENGGADTPLGTGNITLNGGALTSQNNNLTRTQGSLAGEIRITGGISGFGNNANSGATFNIGDVTWGSATFAPTEFLLQTGVAAADAKGTFSSNIDLAGGTRTIRSDQAATNITAGYGVFSGNITGTGTSNLIKTGTGHHYLSGTNNYNGTTAVNQGVLTAMAKTALPGWDASGKLSVAAGATLGVRTAGWSVTDIDTLRGNIAFADNTAAIGLDVNSGTFAYGSNVSGALSVHKYGGGNLQLNGNLSALGGKLIVDSGTISRASGELIVPNIEIRPGTGVSVTMSAILGGTGTLTKTGAGELIFSNVNNTFNGGVTVNGGTLNMSQDLDGSSLGSGALTLGNGAIISFGNSSLTTSNPNIWKAGFQMGGNATWNINGDITLEGNVSYTRSGTVGQSIHMNGDISDGGNGYSLTLGAGAGGGNTYTLAGNNTFSGGLIHNNPGTLRLNSATALGTGPATFGFNTKLDNTSGSALTLSSNNTQIWQDTSLTFTGSNDLNMGTGAVTMNTNYSVTVTAGTFTVGGAVGQSGGTRTLTKAGPGTFVMGGDNTYKGATAVNAGTLIINGNSSTANGAMTVSNSGTTLGGSGTVGGNTTMNAGTILSPGQSPGTLTFAGNLAINNLATYLFEGGDLTAVGGILDLNDNWTLSLGSGFQLGGSVTLFTYGTLAADPDLIPTFVDNTGLGLDLGTLSVTGSGGFITLNGISAVPEPSAALLGGLGLLALLRRRRA